MNMHRPELRPSGPLVGRIVRVEPIEERHREGLREAAERDPQIHRYTNMYSLGFDRWFDLALESTSEVPFVVCVDGRPVGSSRYLNVEPFHRRLEIGWTWLERAQWGTGANIETKYLLMRNAFERWGAMRVEFKTDARNLRVRGALLGVGATFDGIFRKHMILPDSIRDSAWYSVLDDDWPRVKAMLEEKIERHALSPGDGVRCGVDVAPLRAEPDDAAEQVTQALRGEPLFVEERDGGWARVVTAYGYPGWVRSEALEEGPGELPEPARRLAARRRALVSGRAVPLGRAHRGRHRLLGARAHGVSPARAARPAGCRPAGRGPGLEVVELEPGDLITYGEPADHIAFWLGDGRILHSTGRENGHRRRRGARAGGAARAASPADPALTASLPRPGRHSFGWSLS